MREEQQIRAQACYEQNFLQARSLNSQMNQVPVFAMTITGGLWFGAGAIENVPDHISFVLLLFAGLCNLAFILAALRIRDSFQSYLEKIEEFHREGYASGTPKKPKVAWLGSYSMISMYCRLMFIATCLSFLVAFSQYWPSDWLSPICGFLFLLITLIGLHLHLVWSARNREEDG